MKTKPFKTVTVFATYRFVLRMDADNTASIVMQNMNCEFTPDTNDVDIHEFVLTDVKIAPEIHRS